MQRYRINKKGEVSQTIKGKHNRSKREVSFLEAWCLDTCISLPGVGEGGPQGRMFLKNSDSWPPPQTQWIFKSNWRSLNLHLGKLSSWFSHLGWVIVLWAFYHLEQQLSNIQYLQKSTGVPIKNPDSRSIKPPSVLIPQCGTCIVTSSLPHPPPPHSIPQTFDTRVSDHTLRNTT